MGNFQPADEVLQFVGIHGGFDRADGAVGNEEAQRLPEVIWAAVPAFPKGVNSIYLVISLT